MEAWADRLIEGRQTSWKALPTGARLKGRLEAYPTITTDLGVRCSIVEQASSLLMRGTLTPWRGTYSGNDGAAEYPVILSERSESKNPPTVGWAFIDSTPHLLRGTLRLRSLGVCSAQGGRKVR